MMAPKTGEVFLATMQSKSQLSLVEQLRGKVIVNVTGGPRSLYVTYRKSFKDKLHLLPLHSSAAEELNYTTSDHHNTPLNGSGDTTENANPLSQIGEICSVRQGASLNIVLDSEGNVYTFGFGDHGALGQGITVLCPNPKRLTQLENKEIVDIVCGEGHSLALNKHGDVYCWGRGFEGQLGMGHLQCVPFPRLLTGLDRLGFYDVSDQQNPKVVNNIASFIVPNSKTTPATQIPDVMHQVSPPHKAEAKENKVDRVATTLALTLSRCHSKSQEDSHEVRLSHKHAASMNFTLRAHKVIEERKQDAKSHRPSIADPLAIENALTSYFNRVPKAVFKQIKVRKIYAAQNHSFAITTFDQLYGWGDNLSGQLGIKNISRVFEPYRIDLSERIKHLSTCKTHTLLLSENGDIFASGLNTFHQTGLGSNMIYKTFQKLEYDVEGALLPAFKCVETSSCYSIAVSTHRGIYFWGKCFLSTVPQTYPKHYHSNLCPQADFLFANQTNILLFREVECERTAQTETESIKQELCNSDLSSKNTPSYRKMSWNVMNTEACNAEKVHIGGSRQNLPIRKSMATLRQAKDMGSTRKPI